MIAFSNSPKEGDSPSSEGAPKNDEAPPSILRIQPGSIVQYRVSRGGQTEQESFSRLQESIQVRVPIEGKMVEGEILAINDFDDCFVFFPGYSDPTQCHQLFSFYYLKGINTHIHLEGSRIARRTFIGASIAMALGAGVGGSMVSGKVIWEFTQQVPFEVEPPGYNDKRIAELEKAPERIRNGAGMGAVMGAIAAAVEGGIVKIMHGRDARQARKDVEAIQEKQS